MGFIYVVGVSGPVFGPYHAVLIKYDSDGDSVWVKRYYGYMGVGGGFSSIAIDRQNNIYVQSRRETLKYNPNGDTIWVRVFTQSGYNYYGGSYIALDSLDNVFVGGLSSNNFPPEQDYLVYKYDSSGVLKWYQNYNIGYNDAPKDIAVDGLGNVYMTGYTEVPSPPAHDYLTVKYNTNGTLQWARRFYLPSGVNTARAIAIDKNNNIYITGECGPVNVSDIGTIKYNSNGDSLWVKIYNGPGNGNDGAYAIVTDDSGNVYVTGNSLGSGSGYDIATIKYNTFGIQQWVIKYSQLIGVKQISNNFATEYALFQNYPNPFNPVTKIEFSVSSDSRLCGNDNVTLIIYDILGREIAVLVNEELKPGTYEVEWDAINYPSGVYFYRITVADASAPLSINFTETKKMVLLK
jgi:hypothetical protein